MGNMNQINTSMQRLFIDEGKRFDYWNDSGREFQNIKPSFRLDGATTLRFVEIGAFIAAIRVSQEKRNNIFLFTPTKKLITTTGSSTSASKAVAFVRTERHQHRLSQCAPEGTARPQEVQGGTAHLRGSRISLNIDDGVKVSYAKFSDLLAESKAIYGTK